MIQPTIGRVVLVFGFEHQEQARPALVTHVHDERWINVVGFDHNGTPFGATQVQLLQDDDPEPESGIWAEWMPYQKEQAAKHVDGVTDKPKA